jgi:hypothetical protein
MGAVAAQTQRNDEATAWWQAGVAHLGYHEQRRPT